MSGSVSVEEAPSILCWAMSISKTVCADVEEFKVTER